MVVVNIKHREFDIHKINYILNIREMIILREKEKEEKKVADLFILIQMITFIDKITKNATEKSFSPFFCAIF